MRILNLYSGIGGNRKLWTPSGYEHEITAVEYDKAIAEAYQDRYPNDKVVIGDAKQYLLNHYKEFDFIWASPPCQTHTQVRKVAVGSRFDAEAVYPDMSLYQMILFLDNYFKGKYVVENVIPFYTPIIKPSCKIDRHIYWSNFKISVIDIVKDKIHMEVKASDLDKIIKDTSKIKNKVQVVRNQVNYETGKHIFDCALNKVEHKQGGLF